MNTLLTIILSGITVLISAYIIPGVHVDGFFAAVVTAVILAAVNAFVRPILSILTFPINVLTLGLFSLIISAAMVMLSSAIVPGFQVDGFFSALLFGLVLSIINGLLGISIGK